jgi:hypothetical protein
MTDLFAVDTGEEQEDTIFINRCKLFLWRSESSSWVERGLGPIKLNVKRRDPDDEDENPKPSARFVMRAAATHRVVLNARIFKEMQMTLKEKEKRLTFSAPMDGKLVPHMIRVGSLPPSPFPFRRTSPRHPHGISANFLPRAQMGKEGDIKTLYEEIRALQGRM